MKSVYDIGMNLPVSTFVKIVTRAEEIKCSEQAIFKSQGMSTIACSFKDEKQQEEFENFIQEA